MLVILSDEIITLNVVGERCPMPVHKTRKLLRNTPKDSIIHVIGDDPESVHDLPALISRLGLEPPIITRQENTWLFEIRN